MKPLTDKQKKAAWIVAGILLFLHFLPNLTSRLSAFGHRNQRPAVQQPAQVQIAPRVPSPMPNAPQQLDPLAAQYIGRFEGRQLMPDLTNCTMNLEVRPKIAQAGFFTGSETMACVPSSIFFKGPGTAARQGQIPDIIQRAAPVSASMTGSMTDGVMSFRIDQVLGATPLNCGLTTYSIANFGTNQVMAQWEAHPCPAGHMVLVKRA